MPRQPPDRSKSLEEELKKAQQAAAAYKGEKDRAEASLASANKALSAEKAEVRAAAHGVYQGKCADTICPFKYYFAFLVAPAAIVVITPR